MLDPKIFSNDQDNSSYTIDQKKKDEVVEALKTVFDPEIPVDIYELGLIYNIEIDDDHINAEMTLTSPGCPVAGTMPRMVELALMTVTGINSVDVKLVWEPPWDSGRMSEIARLELGME